MKIVLKKDQAYEDLRRRIAQGLLKPGDKLPQGIDLAKEMGISHITLRAALAALERDGLIESIHGRGTFVSRNPDDVMFRTIGLIMPSLGRPLTPEQSPTQYSLVSNLMSAAEERHFEIRTLHRGRKTFDSASVRGVGVDGLVVILPHSSDASMLTELRGLGLPLLLFNLFNTRLSRWYHCVNVDFAGIAAESVSCLHAMGRRRIAFCSCHDLHPDLPPGVLLQGYLDRMEALNLAPTIIQPVVLPYGPLERDEAERRISTQARKLLSADAVIFSHAAEVLAGEAVLRKAGARIPQDTAVIGCFDSEGSEQSGLTAWRAPWHKVADTLLTRMEMLMQTPGTAPEIVLVSGELVRRRSA